MHLFNLTNEKVLKIYKTRTCILVEKDEQCYSFDEDWDQFINRDDLFAYANERISVKRPINDAEVLKDELLAPIGRQEIWASGVTYYKSREARMDESKDSGGGDFYDRVYSADRPELFMKAMPYRTAGPGGKVNIRKDSKWNVPEPELTLLVSSGGKIIGYTAGNDMSSRDIEGENPLYLPQAKCYDQSAAVGPCIYVSEDPMADDSEIHLEILRGDKQMFHGQIEISQIKRKFEDLVHYLMLETSFPSGCYLMTGTGIVPPNEFTLQQGDEIRITIDHIGTLINFVA